MQSERHLAVGLFKTLLVVGLSTTALGYSPKGQAQSAPGALPDNISMVTLNTQMGPEGQTVITPKGYVVAVPGAGVDGPVLQVFMGSRGGFWYVDKYNHQVDLTPTVQRLEGGVAAARPQAVAPQWAPPPMSYGPQQTVVQQQAPAQQGISPAAMAMTSATAAGLGAMTGAAIAGASNSSPWNKVPYGSAIHYGSNGGAYYNNGNKAVYVNPSTDKAYTANDYHSEAAMQEQQNWYKQQQAQGAAKNWSQTTSNPFVREGQSASEGDHYSQAEKNEARGEVDRARLGRFRR